MSHGNGEVLRGDTVVAWFEYNGTSDIAKPALFPTVEMLHENWRSDAWPECTCGQPPEAVMLRTDYGSTMPPWPGKVCLICMCIVEGLDPYDLEPTCG